MSDPDPMKSGGQGSRVPECCPPPTPKTELLSPSKVKDRSQNVTEKVTQVRGPRTSHGLGLWLRVSIYTLEVQRKLHCKISSEGL